MLRKTSIIFIIMAVCVFSLNVVAYADNFDAWLQEAQLGPYVPEKEDWASVYEAAKAEGKVVVYASTSRIFDAAQSFEKQFPGIKVEAYNLKSVELTEKLEREFTAGLRMADVIMTSAINNAAESMLERNILVNYVPPEMIPYIPEAFREPFLCHRFGSVVLAYSDIAFDEQPISSIWELTLPEWENRFLIRDPLSSEGSLGWLASFVRNADAVAADYERVFGKPLQLTTPNAGYELIKKLLDNGLRLQVAKRGVLDAIDQHNIEKPLIGQIGSSSYRDVLAGDYQFDIMWELTPSAGYAYQNALALAGYTKHPNAGKLFLRWLMGGGDEENTGFKPWHVAGNFPARSDIETVAPFKPIMEYDYWYPDQEQYDIHFDVIDFWLTYL